MVTSRPMVRGAPMSVCSTLPSCTLEFSPTTMGSLSPLSTAPHQTEAFRFSTTRPISTAVGATQKAASSSTSRSASARA